MTTDDTPAFSATWRTIDFCPTDGVATTATLTVDGEERMSFPMAGWLIQEVRCFDNETGILRATGPTRVVPGYFTTGGTVEPIDQMPVELNGEQGSDRVRWSVCLSPPKTREVERNRSGDIVRVVEK